MKQDFTSDQLSLLLNGCSLSDDDKNRIVSKINLIFEFIEYLTNIKEASTSVDNLSEIYEELIKEQKATAKLIVTKNNSLSKKLIKTMVSQKELLLQPLEINQLHLEAELKELNLKTNCPAIKTETSVFSKLFGFFRIPFKNITHKKSYSTNSVREKIKLTTSKLNELEKQKENLSKEFGNTGNDALKYISEVTYNSFIPTCDISKARLESLKSKITILN